MSKPIQNRQQARRKLLGKLIEKENIKQLLTNTCWVFEGKTKDKYYVHMNQKEEGQYKCAGELGNGHRNIPELCLAVATSVAAASAMETRTQALRVRLSL
ncbi:hypothetical protein CISG_09993 [Coccidioides immitis RMSCC 3703]|uniref:Uncharacterized protein n=1 Tax=Coccidioides immitis RMSCC 3703 TaxID=454286 RepID=A0A0J8QLI5_COCIT|nr:hypothetical protein CISG_09993 [Coccidioides immitis RMSCC 3703]